MVSPEGTLNTTYFFQHPEKKQSNNKLEERRVKPKTLKAQEYMETHTHRSYYMIIPLWWQAFFIQSPSHHHSSIMKTSKPSCIEKHSYSTKFSFQNTPTTVPLQSKHTTLCYLKSHIQAEFEKLRWNNYLHYLKDQCFPVQILKLIIFSWHLL